MFQHGRRLMVDPCTTCDCFQTAPRKYTLRCTKLNCQACPAVSEWEQPGGSAEGCVWWEPCSSLHTLVYLWYSPGSFGLPSVLLRSLGSFPWIGWCQNQHQIWSKSSGVAKITLHGTQLHRHILLFVLDNLPLGRFRVWQIICNRNGWVLFPTVLSARSPCFKPFLLLFQTV